MTRGRGRFAQIAAAQQAGQTLQPPTIGEFRARQRAEVRQLNNPNVMLPNPVATPPFDRMRSQPYVDKVQALGLAPDYPRSFIDLLRGDAGAASSIFRRTDVFQVLAAPGERTAATPYSQPIAMATIKSSDGRPRYFQCSLFSVGMAFENLPAGFTRGPFGESDVLRFAAGIPENVASSILVNTPSVGIPVIGTVKFRVQVEDESGGRFFDVDVLGTRTFNLYGFAATVFVLIKQDGYEVDFQAQQTELGPGLVTQTVVGARIIPIRSNETKNVNQRTIGLNQPGLGATSSVLTPPGATKVQIFDVDGARPAGDYFLSFRTGAPFGAEVATTNSGLIDFDPAAPNRTAIYDIPNANFIRVVSTALAAPRRFSFVYTETS